MQGAKLAKKQALSFSDATIYSVGMCPISGTDLKLVFVHDQVLLEADACVEHVGPGSKTRARLSVPSESPD